ncbi:uncharacterized protein [Dysidea avara]|uniref:uncharacterized protein n=1 Tax=Dysidea avara TaxID=196820 RepID=UPI00332670E6
MSKPRVLILGGVGFIGRHLTCFLVENDLTSKIRVVDKVPPTTGWLNERHKVAFSKVEYKQANLANKASAEKAFTDPEGTYDIVVNLAAETKYGQSDEVYKERVLTITLNCAHLAAKMSAKKFIELSTAQVYDSGKTPSKEDSKLAPWTHIAKYKLQAEQEIAKIPGLNYVVVRPVIVYGIGDRLGLTPRLIIGAVYAHLKEKMKLLWTKDLRMNTVHVIDVCRALWHLTEHGVVGGVYNLVDKGDTSQGKVTSLISELFQTRHDYFGTVLSNLAKLHLSEAVQESNEKHMAPWSEMCAIDNIVTTPLSPYIDQELLYNRSLSVDGSAIEKTGFQYSVPGPTVELLKEVIEDYIQMRLFPSSAFSGVVSMTTAAHN